MSKLYIVKRRLKVGDNEVVIPLRAFAHAEDAGKFAGENHKAMTEILRYAIISPIGEHLGAFGTLLNEMGVVGFKPEVEELDVEEGLISLAKEIPKVQ